MLDKGMYSIVYKSGEYRTIRIKPWNDKMMLMIKDGTEYLAVGHFNPDGTVSFWRRTRESMNEATLARIRGAVNVVLRDPRAAQLSFAIRESKCARCGRELTVPASLAHGLGPECAGKGRWTKADQQLAFAERQKSAAA